MQEQSLYGQETGLVKSEMVMYQQVVTSLLGFML